MDHNIKNPEPEVVLNNSLLFNGIVDRGLQRTFVWKVLLNLGYQLLLTCVIIAASYFEPIKRYIKSNHGLFISTIIVFWALYTILVSCYGITHSCPQNFIVLILSTVSAAIVVGSICVQYNFTDILTAIIFNAILCSCMALLASLSPFDFTSILGAILLLAVTLFGLIIMVFAIPYKAFQWVIVVYGILLLCIYFIIDMHIIVQGKHQYMMSLDDHILAVTLLYAGILCIFLYLVYCFW